jgi:hypothetical protein
LSYEIISGTIYVKNDKAGAEESRSPGICQCQADLQNSIRCYDAGAKIGKVDLSYPAAVYGSVLAAIVGRAADEVAAALRS